MKITSQQQEVLNSLRCERLSSDVDNLYAVDCFENYKNDTLSFSLKNEAYEEDESSSTAYYLIKNPQNDILFYFSLKCGSLFTELDDEKLKISLKLQKCISEILNNKRCRFV